MKKVFILALTAMTVVTATAAMADDDDLKCDNPSGKWISEDRVRTKAEEAGYEVRRIEKEESCYEIYAINDKNERVELYMNPASGVIVKIDNKS